MARHSRAPAISRSPRGSTTTSSPTACQTAGPELVDFSKESPATLEMYGLNDPKTRAFGTNLLLARRLVERGVRFVLAMQSGWDHHAEINKGLPKLCGATDKPTAALIKDLKQRGLLDQTLVVWGGEFGRTPMSELRRPDEADNAGRDHHPNGLQPVAGGGGIKPGQVIGKTDELALSVAEDKVEIHDLQATILHLLGLDHARLTYRHLGRDFRLTDVGGKVVGRCWVGAVSCQRSAFSQTGAVSGRWGGDSQLRTSGFEVPAMGLCCGHSPWLRFRFQYRSSLLRRGPGQFRIRHHPAHLHGAGQSAKRKADVRGARPQWDPVAGPALEPRLVGLFHRSLSRAGDQGVGQGFHPDTAREIQRVRLAGGRTAAQPAVPAAAEDRGYGQERPCGGAGGPPGHALQDRLPLELGPL